MKFASLSSTLAVIVAVLGCSYSSSASAPRSMSASSECSGFTAESIAAPSLSAPFDVVSVEPITRRIGRVQTGTVVGARIAVVADPSLSTQGANRLLACRMAGAHASDPLAVDGSRVSVSDTRTGYVIEVSAPQPTVGREVFARAEALTTR